MPLLSLVAVDGGKISGHILFTRVKVIDAPEVASAQILAPLAVLPSAQNKGVGNLLVREGLQQLKASGVSLVFVLGYPAYYARFGFVPAGARGLEAPFYIPEKNPGAWKVQELYSGMIEKVEGRIECADVLNHPKYWRE